jgi:hypothetical protein
MSRWTNARDFEIERGYTTQEAIEATEDIRRFFKEADPNYGKGPFERIISVP